MPRRISRPLVVTSNLDEINPEGFIRRFARFATGAVCPEGTVISPSVPDPNVDKHDPAPVELKKTNDDQTE